MITVNVQEAKTHLSRLLADVEKGEEVVIARGGKPVARLSLIGEPGKRRLGFVPGSIPDSFFFDPLPPDELAAWEQ